MLNILISVYFDSYYILKLCMFLSRGVHYFKDILLNLKIILSEDTKKLIPRNHKSYWVKKEGWHLTMLDVV